VTYQGDLVTMRRHIDWKAWIVRRVDGLAVPQGGFRMTILVEGDFCIKVNGWTGSCLI